MPAFPALWGTLHVENITFSSTLAQRCFNIGPASQTLEITLHKCSACRIFFVTVSKNFMLYPNCPTNIQLHDNIIFHFHLEKSIRLHIVSHRFQYRPILFERQSHFSFKRLDDLSQTSPFADLLNFNFNLYIFIINLCTSVVTVSIYIMTTLLFHLPGACRTHVQRYFKRLGRWPNVETSLGQRVIFA